MLKREAVLLKLSFMKVEVKSEEKNEPEFITSVIGEGD